MSDSDLQPIKIITDSKGDISSYDLKLLERRKKAEKQFEKNVMAMTSEQKWRYVTDMMLRMNPQAKAEHDAVVQVINEIRMAQKRDTAATKDNSMRFGLRMPTTVLEAITLTDPVVGVIMNGKDTREQNRLVRKLMKVFPEYKIPKEI